MNLARKLCTIRHQPFGTSLARKFRNSAANFESTHAPETRLQEEKFDFEDLQVLERTERRKAAIPPFMKNVFVSIFNKDLLAYPEILSKEESENLDQRVDALKSVFQDRQKTKDTRRTALKKTRMYAAPVALTNGGLAMNRTESIRYLEVISDDLELAQELSDHWVGLEAVQKGLEREQYQQIVDDLITGENTIKLCIKERVSERITQADFRTDAKMDSEGVWRISGEKICENSSGYLLVLCSVEAERMKGFLVHPNAAGVTRSERFVSFLKTPATPLELITENGLAQTLGLSRLHAAALCRIALSRAVQACVDYVRPRVFAGKPLSELSTIRSTIGDAVLAMYASESAEYFTAGLMDGYENPDAELEMAMCRNFMSDSGLAAVMNLLSIPAFEQEMECKQLLDDMRHIAARGDTFNSVNMFIALNGIHHAGKMMSEEIKRMRNPLFHPTFIIKKVLANRHQEKDEPKLDLYLAEYLHPTLKIPAENLEYCVIRMRYACEALMHRHGMQVASAYTELKRLAEAASEILAMTASLARASRSYCIGLKNSELEMKMAACFVDSSKEKVRRLIREINDGEYLNLDHFRIEFGKKTLETNSKLLEHPTGRTFW